MNSRSNMAKLIERFRNLCLQKYSEDIHVLSKERRDDRLGLVEKSNRLAMLYLGTVFKPIDNICRLAKTPRLLKLILRRTHRIWEHLHGEIDLDDILVANTLRFGAPEAFEFLLENQMEIQGLKGEDIFKNHDNRLEAIEGKWDRTAELAKWDKASARSLVQFLFPCWNKVSGETESLQGIQVSMPTDYWLRYLSEDIGPDTFRDQEVLRGMAAWRQDPGGAHFRKATLSSILCDNADFASKFEYFAPLTNMDGHDIRKIATTTFRQALDLQGVETCSDSVAGFIPLWRLAVRNPVDETEHLEWVKNEVFKAFCTSLRFANNIYYFWRSNTQSDIEETKPKPGLRNQVMSHAKEIFEGKPNDYIAVIDPSYMYSSYQFSIGYSEPEQGGEGFTAAKWIWLAKLLLDAGEIAPQIIVPQIVPFVIEAQGGIENFTYNFKEVSSKELFGNEMPRLMNVLSKEINVDSFDFGEKKRIQAAKCFTIEWPKKNHS